MRGKSFAQFVRNSQHLYLSIGGLYYSAEAGGVMWSFVLSVNRITHKVVNIPQPNMVGMGNG